MFALFVPFYCSIPKVQVTQILGPLSITNKTLIYILGLQVQLCLFLESLFLTKFFLNLFFFNVEEGYVLFAFDLLENFYFFSHKFDLMIAITCSKEMLHQGLEAFRNLISAFTVNCIGGKYFNFIIQLHVKYLVRGRKDHTG